eukprot:Gb_39500 [translate_table: standard]
MHVVDGYEEAQEASKSEKNAMEAIRIQGLKIRPPCEAEITNDSFEESQHQLTNLIRVSPGLRPIAAKKLRKLLDELLNGEESEPPSTDSDPFEKIKHGFLRFKQQQFLKKPDLFKKLSTGQNPKMMVIACSDSRVCPSNILGFKPGEAFVVRNVANLIPPWKEVEHILIIGHSRCGGIKALMSMTDEGNKSSNNFIEDWIEIGKTARLQTKSVAANLDIDQQCSHCEKESVKQSLMNLITFPWIKERVSEDKLFLHGAHYNFVDCSFERWTLKDFKSVSVQKLS